MTAENKIKDKIRKLLNQAEDRAGEPEADVFMGKALELLAKYGFDARDLGADSDGSEFVSHTFKFSGSYTDMQAYLLGAIVNALHCKAYCYKRARSTRHESMVVFGMSRHVERIKILFPLLNNAMASQLGKVEHSDPFGTISIVTERRSFMFGFSNRILERLREAEKTAGGETDGDKYALVLVEDREATEAAWKNFTADVSLQSNARRNRVTAKGLNHGRNAANNADIGQTRVGHARAALTT